MCKCGLFPEVACYFPHNINTIQLPNIQPHPYSAPVSFPSSSKNGITPKALEELDDDDDDDDDDNNGDNADAILKDNARGQLQWYVVVPGR